MRRPRQRRDEESLRGEHVVRLLLGEDGLEHVVAPHRHVTRRRVRERRRHDEGDQHGAREHGPDAARCIDHGEEAEREDAEIDDQQGRDEPPVEHRQSRLPAPRHDGRQDEQDQRRRAEQQEPAAPRAPEELSRTRQEHREKPGEKRASARLGHARSLGMPAAAADARKS